MTTSLPGACHCGQIRIAFETALDPAAMSLRACQCAFCRRHGAVTTSDPAGLLRIEVRAPEQLQRYRFALGMTDFLVCRTCGVYVAATMVSGAGTLGVLNARALDAELPFAEARPMEYGAEGAEAREARRAKVWMPVVIT